MDQDFHYYGTYYAAAVGGGYNQADATTIAKACNFIDFLSNESYAGYWKLVTDTTKPNGDFNIVGSVDYPRYTFQGNFSVGVSGGSGLWGSYHFTPGNYADPNGSPSHADVHGNALAGQLPGHIIRDVDTNASKLDADIAKLLNRPQSALSRVLIQDTVNRLQNPDLLKEILLLAEGGAKILENNDEQTILKKFGLMLLGIRAHVIADTWAHQDFSGLDNVINTYWDISGNVIKDQVYQQIEYQDTGDWIREHLSSSDHENLQAVPNNTSYLGHGWMGHFPDYSFVKFKYIPYWSKNRAVVLRDNPTEYRYALLELCSLFSQANNGTTFDPSTETTKLNAAQQAISAPCEIANKDVCPRRHSSQKWYDAMEENGIDRPDLIDAKLEPDPNAVLDGKVHYESLAGSRYGTFYINYASDLYLFEIAADYHFQHVKNWLTQNKIGASLFNESWSKQYGPLSEQAVGKLF